MIRSGSIDGARSNRRHLSLDDGTTYWKSDFVVSPEHERPAPQAFLIEQDPDTVIRPHYHSEDQFQVVVAGDGTLGRHRVGPLSVHYAGAYTGYGPITASGRGLAYLSLRPMTTARAWFLPESRSEMKNVPRRHLLGARAAPSDAAALRALASESTEPLIEPQPDGIAAWCLRLPPGASASPPACAKTLDRFYVVTAGAMHVDGERLSRCAVCFVTADEHDFRLSAGDEGLEVLALQFPASAIGRLEPGRDAGPQA